MDRRNVEFRAGAFYRDGVVVIPSYIYCKGMSERCAEIWARNGFRLNRDRQQWERVVPEDKAELTIKWANAHLQNVWQLPFGEAVAHEIEERNQAKYAEWKADNKRVLEYYKQHPIYG